MRHKDKYNRIPSSKKIRVLALAATAALTATVCPLSVSAQASASAERFSPSNAGYLERARTMAGAGNYAGVIDQIDHLVTQHALLSPAQTEEAVFMLAEAYYQRGDNRCVELLEAFCRNYPASLLARDARMTQGDFYFFAHDFAKALTAYNRLDYSAFDKEERPLYTYRKALSMIKSGYYDEAIPLLEEIKGNSSYTRAATFYTAYIDYVKGNYKEAYSLFSKVDGEGESSSRTSMRRRGEYEPSGIEPGYYMTQIEYVWKEYDKVISHGSSLLQKMPVASLRPETQRVIGMSYFKIGDWQTAKSYLSDYASSTDAPVAESVYALGVIDYLEKDYEKALDKFATLTDLNNDIAQSAWLYTGQCEVALGNDPTAILAFEKAAKMNFDSKVGETALYNYAAAVTRGNTVPFSSSSELLEKFVTSYPDSQYAPQVEEYLATAYYNDRNYSRALENINKIKNPSKGVLAARQKILYELGMQMMNDGKPDKAEKYLAEAAKMGSSSADIAAQANLWLGDARYSLGDYRQAKTAYNAYLSSSSGKNGANHTLALYNLAYTDYMLEDYRGATSEFTKALKASPSLPTALSNDARIRMADCKYYTGNYAGALADYSQAISAGASDSDYATFRRAVMYGLGGNIDKKLAELADLEKRFPGSKWISASLMERAQSYGALDRPSEAARIYDELTRRYPQTADARKASLGKALEFMKAGEKEKAVEAYQEIIKTWPSSQEAATANEDLRKYYAANGALLEYAEFLRSVPGARQLDVNEMESLAFEAAESAYAENPDATALLEKYVAQYPDGTNLAAALLDLASAYKGNGKYSEALSAADALISKRKFSPQYPEALLIKAEILEDKMTGRRPDALASYKELEASGDKEFLPDAYLGIMRTTDNPAELAEYARKARMSGGLGAEEIEEASLYEARGLLRNGNTTEAVAIYSSLAQNPKSLAGAKAAVELGQYFLDKKDYKNAEKTFLEFTDEGTQHEYWLAMGFIGLADTYKNQGKSSLAKEYLKSLRDNYPNDDDDIKQRINQRLKEWK